MLNARAKILSIVKNISSDRLVYVNYLQAKKRFLYKNSIIKIASRPFKVLISHSANKLQLTYFKKLSNLLILNFINRGYLYAKITSRPGQGASVSGVILEREEIISFINKKKYKKFL